MQVNHVRTDIVTRCRTTTNNGIRIMRTKVFLASLLVAASCQVMAQSSGTVGGRVVDETGEPVIGAQVKVKGAKTGTVTDIDGNFTMPANVKAGTEIEISYLGMESQTVKGGHRMEVKMQSQHQQLDEVIVVAYGQQKKSSFTGSAGVVNTEKISNRQVTTVVDALEGQVAGVQMIKTSGDPTATPTILVRGISSINASTEPLIVVDGSPYYGSWSDINPADVASMTVLKDAASNAMYGARGANGVILITTKNPQKGKTTITVDAKWGSNSRASQTYDVISNPGQYYELFYKALYNYNVNSLNMSAAQAHMSANEQMTSSITDGGLGYLCYEVPNNEYLIGTNGKLNPNATLGKKITYEGQEYTVMPDDWVKEAYRNTLRQEYNININGGNDAAQVYASLGYLDDPGIAYGSAYKRYTARLKSTYQAKDWLKIGGNLNYVHSTTDYASTSSGTSTFYIINRIAPIYPVYVRDGNGNIMTDQNGKMYDYGNYNIANLVRPVLSDQNPLKDDQLQTNGNVSNSIYLTGFADITPAFIKGLKLTVNGTVSDYEYRTTMTNQPFYGWGLFTYPTGGITKGHYRYYTVNFQQLINYVRSFGNHNMTLLLGHENYRQTDESLYASHKNMFSYFGNHELSGAVEDENSYSTQTKYNTEGYFFRGMYDYDGKYFGQFSFRRDASSRFDPSNRWGNFFSLGGAWILTKEKWMEGTKEWLSMLKLKASFGQQGNDAIGDYMYMNTYYMVNSNDQLGLTINNIGNKDITWETNTNVNVGVDFELFNSRLRGSFEYFYRKTTDMLNFVHVPLSDGYAGYWDNVGDMVNKGIELDLTFDAIHTNDLLWSINLNATHYKNKITYLYEDNKTNMLGGHPGYVSSTQFYGEGLPIYTWRLKKYAGVDEEGYSMWYATNSDGTLSRTSDYNSGDYYDCGAPQPDVYGGFGTSVQYKGFDFAINFTYSLGGKVYDSNYQTLMASPSTSTLGQGFHKDVLDAWSETNKGSNIPRWQYNDTYTNATSDRFLISGSYLSLQSINLGYTMPQAWIKPLGLTKVRVYAAADNVYLWTKRKGLDPRTSYTGFPATEQYSFVRTISGGVTLQF